MTDHIRKVYTIWICPCTKDDESSLMVYETTQKAVAGKVRIPKKAYDKIGMIVLRLNENDIGDACDDEYKALRFLNVLFSRKMSIEECKEVLEREYHIRMTEDIKEDMNRICNYSDAIERIGIEKGEVLGEWIKNVNMIRGWWYEKVVHSSSRFCSHNPGDCASGKRCGQPDRIRPEPQ